jgi:NADH dehydrogenase [ubiquinone] 1 alpha subcomplex assembly factor 1
VRSCLKPSHLKVELTIHRCRQYFKDPLPLEVFHIAAAEDLSKIALASDSDLGGSSRIDLRLGASGEADESWAMKGVPHGIFSGRTSLAVREEIQGRVRGGFVGWRTKVRLR